MSDLLEIHITAAIIPLVTFVVILSITARRKQLACRKMHDWRILVLPLLVSAAFAIIWMVLKQYTFFAAGLLWGAFSWIAAMGLYFLVHVMSSHRL